MDDRIIVLVNGIDPSLEGMKFGPALLKVAREYDSEPSPIRDLRYRMQCYEETDEGLDAKVFDYCGKPYSESTIERILACNSMYEFLYQLFAYESSERQRYLVPTEYDAAMKHPTMHDVDTGSFYKFLEETSFFTYLEWMGPQYEWVKEADLILDSVRLFKLSCAGFGIMTCIGNGLGANDLGEMETSESIKTCLPMFTLNDPEKIEYEKFYEEYRNWNQKPAIDKDMMIQHLITLFRTSFASRDHQSSFITQAVIWESFVKCFPEIKRTKNDKKQVIRVSERIRMLISAFLRNNKESTNLKENDMTIYKLIRYLYDQRCEYAHGGGNIEKNVTSYAIDVSRCLIRKLVEIDDDFEDIIENVASSAKCSNGSVEIGAYPSSIEIKTIEPALAEKIMNSKRRDYENRMSPIYF